MKFTVENQICRDHFTEITEVSEGETFGKTTVIYGNKHKDGRLNINKCIGDRGETYCGFSGSVDNTIGSFN